MTLCPRRRRVRIIRRSSARPPSMSHMYRKVRELPGAPRSASICGMNASAPSNGLVFSPSPESRMRAASVWDVLPARWKSLASSARSSSRRRAWMSVQEAACCGIASSWRRNLSEARNSESSRFCFCRSSFQGSMPPNWLSSVVTRRLTRREGRMFPRARQPRKRSRQ